MHKEEAVRYTVTIHLAAPGTPRLNGDNSFAGHMFLSLNRSDSHEAASFGFTLEPTRENPKQGKVDDGDLGVYKDPRYQRTMEITKDQYEKIREFATDPKKHGFDTNYDFFTNACTDFAWGALNHAGLHRQTFLGEHKSYEGAAKVLQNIPAVESIPQQVKDSELDKVIWHDMPKQTLRDQMFTERGEPGDAAGRIVGTSSPEEGHRANPLLSQINEKVAALDAANGRDFDATSERITASLYALARENDFSSVDHVLLSTRTATNEAAHNIFIVQGERDNPAHTRASLPTALAAQTPVEVSFERVEQLAQTRQQSVPQSVQEHAQQQQVEEQRAGPRMA